MAQHARHSLTIDAVLLAAGLSQRMGAPNKLLMPIGGEPLVRRSLRLYSDIARRVVVVFGHEAERVQAALDGLAYAGVFNENYQAGQQSSVSAGLGAAGSSADAVLVALADQPLLTGSDIQALVDTFADSPRDKIVIPYRGEVRGNPVLIPRAIVRRILDQGENPGCRRFIDANPDLVMRYPASNTHFTTDLDTPEDARSLGIAINHAS
jgi:molybdenum cofactor cytidylyltransferase